MKNLHPAEPPDGPVPNTPLDAALIIVALRRLIVLWRERGAAAPEREGKIYRQAEADVTAVIEGHSDMRRIWCAARQDLISAFAHAMDKREESRP